MPTDATKRRAVEHTQHSRKKVVVHLLDGTVLKGELTIEFPLLIDGMLEAVAGVPPEVVRLNAVGSAAECDIPLTSVKAMFFVQSFEGDKERFGIRFYTHPYAQKDLGLWVEIRFSDDETMEGIIGNSLHHVISPGFLLTPSDPGSNNLGVYINKAAIKAFRVLGLRPVS